MAAGAPIDAGGLYFREAMTALPRLLAATDREPHSRTYGCVDRDYWGWKFRDFPLTMLQLAAHPLALAWQGPRLGNPYHHNPVVFRWIEAMIRHVLQRQHRDGAFDSVAPNTKDYGVTLAVVYGVIETLTVLGDAASQPLRALARDAVQRACDFALPLDEEYAFISNHQALFAMAFLNASVLLDDRRCRERASAIVASILGRQAEDGWYPEYGGPDPGYESLGILFLATYWRRTQEPSVLASLRRSIEFYAHCVHPDGSVGGVYGSRCTSLYVPAGFEILAPHLTTAAGIAAFMRERLQRHNVVTPATCDLPNLPPLLYGYLEAGRSALPARTPSPTLPCQSLEGVYRFDASGLAAAGTRRYYAVMSMAKGGVIRIFDRHTERLAYEDAGYLVQARRSWTSQAPGLGVGLPPESPDEVVCEAPFVDVRQEALTPGRLLVLRLLNLTAFRSRTLARAVQRRVIRRLITGWRIGPLRLRRSVVFGHDSVRFRDCLEATTRLPRSIVHLSRALTPMHMGSANYFHPSQLIPTFHPDCASLGVELHARGRAVHEFTITFPGEPVTGCGTALDGSRPAEVPRS
jgi:hypothetical protein